jgi:hypothetical protein
MGPRRAIAALGAAALTVGATLVVTTGIEGPLVTTHHSKAASSAFVSGTFLGPDGRLVGHVSVSAGTPSRVFMNVDDSRADGAVICEVEMAEGSVARLAAFQVHDGLGEWADMVGINVSWLHGARLVTPTGATLASATFPSLTSR